jgi:hypothetical protein
MFKVPPHTKMRVVATVEKRLCAETEHIQELEVERVEAEDRCQPDWSNTIKDAAAQRRPKLQDKTQRASLVFFLDLLEFCFRVT